MDGQTLFSGISSVGQLNRNRNESTFSGMYRTFNKYWHPIKEHAGRFDNRVKSILGGSIMVTFNSNQAKEVGTNHTVGTWYHRKPTFFQMQYWAPYFSPPEDNRDLRVASMPSVTPQVLTAARFQDPGRAAHQYCLRIMDRTEDLRKTGKDTLQRIRGAVRPLSTTAERTVQDNLVTRDGPVERELERMRVLLAR
ncbi:hypothetical protein ED733_000091 [Metarhizium rileyi]|uniref:Uncharacterized protein n=1 Tax=Metarhizium rileyi (strain RCEF 4871) TaxID=1649241 RepID=A0A5C6FYZ0_METRR|nr:hypothetical protein ED733_000091 [Metarhizium rileyi]